jgi:GNAT superfamily N-acetyltransferase
MPVDVREATDSDLPALAALRRQWHLERGRDVVGDATAFDAAFTRWCREHGPVLRIVVACDGSTVVGMGFLVLVDRVPKPGDLDRRHGDIQSMYVSPSYRDAGVGSEVVRALTDLARELGCIRVEVHSGRRAVPFYLRSGFEDAPQLLEHPLD